MGNTGELIQRKAWTRRYNFRLSTIGDDEIKSRAFCKLTTYAAPLDAFGLVAAGAPVDARELKGLRAPAVGTLQQFFGGHVPASDRTSTIGWERAPAGNAFRRASR